MSDPSEKYRVPRILAFLLLICLSVSAFGMALNNTLNEDSLSVNETKLMKDLVNNTRIDPDEGTLHTKGVTDELSSNGELRGISGNKERSTFSAKNGEVKSYTHEVVDSHISGGLSYPTDDGEAGYVMTTDGVGNLSLKAQGLHDIDFLSQYYYMIAESDTKIQRRYYNNKTWEGDSDTLTIDFTPVQIAINLNVCVATIKSENGFILTYSTDTGESWTDITDQGWTKINDLHYAHGYWFVAGKNTENTEHLKKSIDGINWTVVVLNDANVEECFGVCYNGKRLILSYKSNKKSETLIGYTTKNLTEFLSIKVVIDSIYHSLTDNSNIAYGKYNGKETWFGIIGSKLWCLDGSALDDSAPTLQTIELTDYFQEINDIADNNGVLVVIGKPKSTSDGASIIYSTDGVTWIKGRTDVNEEFTRVCASGGHWFVQGISTQGDAVTGLLLKSDSGKSWNQLTTLDHPILALDVSWNRPEYGFSGTVRCTDIILSSPQTPSSSTAAAIGTIQWDDTNLYIRTETSWKKVALTSL